MIRLTFAVLLAIVGVSAAFDPTCRGRAMYKVVFKNFLTNENFGDLPGFPTGGLIFSPIAGVSHSNRQSFLTVRGFASPPVEEIAETGNNARFLKRANRLMRMRRGVKSVAGAGGPTLPGKGSSITLEVNCKHSFITVLSMIAPSPDWIVQINNQNTYSSKKSKFRSLITGNLIAYDAGVDSGREFTAPNDPSLDIPTEPKKNIAPLVEDDTDRFDGRVVGKWIIKKIR